MGVEAQASEERANMLSYIARRILYAIPIAFGVSVVCFSLVYIAPGDPLQTVMPPDATADMIAIVKQAYGFDRPLPVQFVDLARQGADRRLRHVDRHTPPGVRRVGARHQQHRHAGAVPVPISFTIGFVMGTIAGCFPGRWIDRTVTGTAVIGVSLPNYWLGIVLVIIFAVEWSILPATGMGPQRLQRLQPAALGRRASS